MKKFYLILFCLPAFAWVNAHGQIYPVYLQLPNKMHLEKKFSNIETDNGEIKVIDRKTFLWTPLTTGYSNIFLSNTIRKNSGKREVRQYFVISPKPLFYLGEMPSDTISIKELLELTKPTVRPEFKGCPDNDLPASVKSFCVMAIRDNTVLFKINNQENNFCEETRFAFRRLVPGDTLLFFNITGFIGAIPPAEYRLVE